MLTIAEITESFEATYGFNPCYVYCLVTGKAIGYTFPEELESVITFLDADLESAVDDLAMRITASMRPSMKWNKMREHDLDSMRKSAPVETMAYLLNRLITPPKDAKYTGFFSLHRDRIMLFHHLLADYQLRYDVDADYRSAWDSAMLMLLEIEAKLSLLTESSPITVDRILDMANVACGLAMELEAWHKRRVKYHADQEADAKFFAANPGAKRAFFNSWFEQKPPSEKQVAAAAKQQDKNFMAGILDELMGVGDLKPAAMRPDVVAPQPAVIAPTKMPTRFGVKKAPDAA
jgi:hypothetical protein